MCRCADGRIDVLMTVLVLMYCCVDVLVLMCRCVDDSFDVLMTDL